MKLQEFASKIRSSRNIVFFTGAGISTESGIPDFRSPGGIWTKYTPVYFDDFVNNEAERIRYWKMKKESLETYKKNVNPNLGHYSIKAFEDRGQLLGLITQNVDGLHAIAGVSKDKIVELHGTDRKVVCLECSRLYPCDEIYSRLVGDFKPPLCDDCNGILKPATVSFGQAMPVEAMKRAQALSQSAEMFVVVGTSLQVQPAASFPVIAKQSGAFVAIVNRDATPLDDVADYNFKGEIGDFFRQLNPLLSDA
ncbi:MAG: Sir2 family NAD-dependent protein deacetylase [Deltaproteobacteria bacterium]|nr:Sir2 family NAD-dependent protein deacetylase [Deltaproteobacteria bacterium]